jgi:hypothetical protein
MGLLGVCAMKLLDVCAMELLDACACRKQAYDAGFFAKVHSAKLVQSVEEAESLTNADARITYAASIVFSRSHLQLHLCVCLRRR